MKSLMSLLMIFSFMAISFSFMKVDLTEFRNKRVYHKRFNKIKKATVKITQYLNQNSGPTGSGFLIQNKENRESFIMTNAHVCIYDFSNYVKSSYHRNFVFPQRELKLNIDGKKGFTFIKIKGSELEIHYRQDVCFIPVNPKDFPKKNFAFIDSPSRDEVKEFAKDKKDHLMLFTLNHAQKGEVLVKKGVFKFYENPLMVNINNSSSFLRDKGALSSIDVVPGDSGSVIVDKNLDVVGVAYGSELNLDFFQRSGNSKWDLESCLQRNYIQNKRDLAFIKSDLSEIDGAFYPLAFLGN